MLYTYVYEVGPRLQDKSVYQIDMNSRWTKREIADCVLSFWRHVIDPIDVKEFIKLDTGELVPLDSVKKIVSTKHLNAAR